MREIIYEASFIEAMHAVGGAYIADLAMESVIPGLTSDPEGYRLHKNSITSFRYAVTREVDWPNRKIPPLIIIFVIGEFGNVHLQHIEVFEP
jgi:hypothetical protein